MRGPADNAELALLLEVSGTPKPGNVDREREYPELLFEQFLAGAVGARSGFELAAEGGRVGRAFERAVAGMAEQRAGNTQFGAILAVTPLVAASARDALDRTGVQAVIDATTVADSADFFRAFDHVEVAVREPPAGMEALDVRRGSDCVPAVEERGITLGELLERSAAVDGVAAELSGGFPRTFEGAATLLDGRGSVTERASQLYIDLLASEPDTFVITHHDRETALEVRDRARAVRAGEADPAAFAEELIERRINPGTTADVVAAALFVALERGLEV